MRLIDADALEDKARQYSLGYYEEDEWAVPFKEITSAPTIDAVEVVRGEWIDEHEGGHGEWVGTCNQCGKTARVGNFCPNCGAKMKE